MHALGPEATIEGYALRGEPVDRIGGVGSVGGDGALDPGAVAGPDLHLPIAGPDEEDVSLLGVRGVDDGDGVRLVEAGQEEEVGALAEFVADVAVATGLLRPRDDREGVAERRREAQPPVREGSELTGCRHGSSIAYNGECTAYARFEGGPMHVGLATVFQNPKKTRSDHDVY